MFKRPERVCGVSVYIGSTLIIPTGVGDITRYHGSCCFTSVLGLSGPSAFVLVSNYNTLFSQVIIIIFLIKVQIQKPDLEIANLFFIGRNPEK